MSFTEQLLIWLKGILGPNVGILTDQVLDDVQRASRKYNGDWFLVLKSTDYYSNFNDNSDKEEWELSGLYSVPPDRTGIEIVRKAAQRARRGMTRGALPTGWTAVLVTKSDIDSQYGTAVITMTLTIIHEET